MHIVGLGLRSLASIALLLCAWSCVACGGGSDAASIDVQPAPEASDAGIQGKDPTQSDSMGRCDGVQVDGDIVVEHAQDFTARFRVGAAYSKTVMLFGGETMLKPNTLTRAYIIGLDKVDAQLLAKKYPDFYLCSSAGGREASTYIRTYDLVPATCEIYNQLVAALRQYNVNVAKAGDRTSLRLEGSPLSLESVVDDATGQDVSDQVSGQQFHLVTGVKQLSGESVLSFGTSGNL
jgi:hypothetical protein